MRIFHLFFPVTWGKCTGQNGQSIQSFRFLFIIIVCIYVYQRRQIPHEDCSAILRKGRTPRIFKQLLDLDCSQSEDRDVLGEGNRNVRNAVRIRRSRSKSAVRYTEDSDIDDNVKRLAKEQYNEDDNCVAYKNVDPLKQKENGPVKRRSAQEAAKRFKKNFDLSSDDEVVVLG